MPFKLFTCFHILAFVQARNILLTGFNLDGRKVFGHVMPIGSFDHLSMK